MVYATLVEDAGAMADRGEVRDHLDTVLRRAETGPKGDRRRGATMTAAQASRIAADLEDYDTKIAKGKPVDG